MKNFVLVVLLSICLLIFPLIVYAQVKDAYLDSTASAMMDDYPLPYPGLLPDHPLYKIKVIRDKIIEFLIADSLKKSEFYLLESDKRLNGGVTLLKKHPNKSELSYSTISKSENYFAKVIEQVKEAKNQGKDVANQLNNLKRSLRKHKSVIDQLSQTSSGRIKEQLGQSDKRLKEFDRQLSSILPN